MACSVDFAVLSKLSIERPPLPCRHEEDHAIKHQQQRLNCGSNQQRRDTGTETMKICSATEVKQPSPAKIKEMRPRHRMPREGNQATAATTTRTIMTIAVMSGGRCTGWAYMNST